jgi:hypothetical protein
MSLGLEARINGRPCSGIVMSGRRPRIKEFFAVAAMVVGAVMSPACLRGD